MHRVVGGGGGGQSPLESENWPPRAAQVRDLIYREALEYHPQAKREYESGETPSRFVFPSAVDNFKRQFAHLEAGGNRAVARQANSLPREQSVRLQPCARAGC